MTFEDFFVEKLLNYPIIHSRVNGLSKIYNNYVVSPPMSLDRDIKEKVKYKLS